MQIMSRELAFLLLVLSLVVACSGTQAEVNQDQAQRAPSNIRGAEWRPTEWVRASTRFIKNRLLPFKNFKAKFHKNYASESEESLRHALYTDRVIKSAITFKKYITKGLRTFKSVNSRSDMTKAERQKVIASRPERIYTGELEQDDLTIMAQDALAMAPASGHEAAASYIASWFAKRKEKPAQVYRTVDLRDTKCFNPPGNQGGCESCASFVAVAHLEYLRCRETKILEKFSEQFTLDCGKPFGMMGCTGSHVKSVLRQIAQVGLVLNATYAPYVAYKRKCPYYNTFKQRYVFESADTLKLRNEAISGVQYPKWSALLEKKIPVHIGLKVNEDFEDYGGGVDGSCYGSNGAHGMLLVGEGREDGVDYWLLRNSYGTDWGIDGHYKISKQATGCISDEGMGYFPAAFTKTFGNSFVRNLA